MTSNSKIEPNSKIKLAIDYSRDTSAHAQKASEGGRGLHEEVWKSTNSPTIQHSRIECWDWLSMKIFRESSMTVVYVFLSFVNILIDVWIILMSKKKNSFNKTKKKEDKK